MKKFLLLVICFSGFSILQSQETKINKMKEKGIAISSGDLYAREILSRMLSGHFFPLRYKKFHRGTREVVSCEL